MRCCRVAPEALRHTFESSWRGGFWNRSFDVHGAWVFPKDKGVGGGGERIWEAAERLKPCDILSSCHHDTSSHHGLSIVGSWLVFVMFMESIGQFSKKQKGVGERTILNSMARWVFFCCSRSMIQFSPRADGRGVGSESNEVLYLVEALQHVFSAQWRGGFSTRFLLFMKNIVCWSHTRVKGRSEWCEALYIIETLQHAFPFPFSTRCFVLFMEHIVRCTREWNEVRNVLHRLILSSQWCPFCFVLPTGSVSRDWDIVGAWFNSIIVIFFKKDSDNKYL